MSLHILLHVCCSNCALYPVKVMRSEGHDCHAFWFNPNIHPEEEYGLRLDSFTQLTRAWDINVSSVEEYRPEEYFGMFASDSPPFPERCTLCYRLRLEKTAEHASRKGFDAFSTTLLISPYQDFDRIASLGRELSDKYQTDFYLEDFRPYFRDAIALSKDMGLYRQKYCGCIFSRNEKRRIGEKSEKGRKSPI